MAKKTPTTEITESELHLMEQVNGLRQEVLFLNQRNARLNKELEELKEKYALLLGKHISMMERCVGTIPKIRWPEEEEDDKA